MPVYPGALKRRFFPVMEVGVRATHSGKLIEHEPDIYFGHILLAGIGPVTSVT
jgi:hypothetical protein